VEGNFGAQYFPTIENKFVRNIKYKNQDFTTEIIDTAGQDEYSIIQQNHAIGIHGYILVYSITSKASFEMIRTIREKILNYTGIEWIPCVIVGNKRDLENQRAVSSEEGISLANEWKCAFIETSAKTNENIRNNNFF
jgi:Ras family protein